MRTARALFDGGVLLDGTPARPSDRVRSGAIVESPPPTEVVRSPAGAGRLRGDIRGLRCDRGRQAGRSGGPPRFRPAAATLAAGLLHRYPELEGVGDPGRWGLIHRLDRDTSGLLVVARTALAFDRLSADMAGRRIRRLYTALVHGRFAIPTGTIDAPIGRDPNRPDQTCRRSSRQTGGNPLRGDRGVPPRPMSPFSK